jgi:hypothetical protein
MRSVQQPILGPKKDCEVLFRKLQTQIQQAETEINFRHNEYLRNGASECPDCGHELFTAQYVLDHPELSRRINESSGSDVVAR